MTGALITAVALRALAVALVTAGLVWACTPEGKPDPKTAIEISMCVQSVVLEHIDEDLHDPIELAELALLIDARCRPSTEEK